MREKFFKNKFVKTSRNFITNEKVGNIDLFSVVRYELTNRFR